MICRLEKFTIYARNLNNRYMYIIPVKRKRNFAAKKHAIERGLFVPSLTWLENYLLAELNPSLFCTPIPSPLSQLSRVPPLQDTLSPFTIEESVILASF